MWCTPICDVHCPFFHFISVFFNERRGFDERRETDERREIRLIERHIAKEGSLTVRISRSVFYGEPAAGKTSTRKRLTGEIENLGQQLALPSTGIEKPCTINLYRDTEKCSVLLTRSLEDWKEQDIALQCQTLLQYLLFSSQGDSSQAIQQNPALQESKASQVTVRTRPTLVLGRGRRLPRDGALQKFLKNVTASEQWKEVREGLKAIEDITILHITDTGGQPEFYDILPLLLQGCSIFLLFYNLSRPLDQHSTISYRWGEGRSSAVYESQFTLKEMLFQLLVSVASSSSTEKPNAAVMFVGTYLDRVGEEGLLSQERKLKDMIQSTEFFRRDVVKTFPLLGDEKLIFPLDNISGSPDEIAKLRASIAQAIEQAFDPVSLPTSWLLFHLVLRREYEANPGYCTVEQCIEVAKSCHIPPRVVKDILKFMHKKFGTILYYHKVKSFVNLVICDPNIIFKRITQLVALSFGANPDRPQTSKEIRELGEIDPLLMEEEKKKESSPISMSHIVDLLTYHNIISEIKKFDGSHVYFMPCLLLPDPLVGKDRKQALLDLDPAPLLILFSTGYIPLGLFSSLVVYLSKLDSWVIDPVECRYRNKVHFEVDGSTDLVLISHATCLELRATAPEASLAASKCPYVVKVIKRAVEAFKSHHKFMKFGNSLGFYCLSDLKVESGTPHHADCWETARPEAGWNQMTPAFMRCCSKCVVRRSKLLEKHQVWFMQVILVCISNKHVLYVQMEEGCKCCIVICFFPYKNMMQSRFVSRFKSRVYLYTCMYLYRFVQEAIFIIEERT